ncbi:MAG: hypothetical protein Q9225_006512 [Loekoesia sp. 1 TL-2023]
MATEQSTSPADAPQFSSEEMETEELTLESGAKITIGRPKGSAAAKQQVEAAKKDNAEVMYSHGPSFTLPMNWQAGSEGFTDSDCKSRTGISQWGVQVGGLVFKYQIWFVTDQTYDYQFQDQSNQWYDCDVWLKGAHYVDYNSAQISRIYVDDPSLASAG